MFSIVGVKQKIPYNKFYYNVELNFISIIINIFNMFNDISSYIYIQGVPNLNVITSGACRGSIN